jgi:hypothetical protein
MSGIRVESENRLMIQLDDCRAFRIFEFRDQDAFPLRPESLAAEQGYVRTE